MTVICSVFVFSSTTTKAPGRESGRFARDPEVLELLLHPRGKVACAAAAAERHDIALVQPPLPAVSTALGLGIAAAGALGRMRPRNKLSVAS